MKSFAILLLITLGWGAAMAMSENSSRLLQLAESKIFPEQNEHGFIPVGTGGDDIFYWYFPARNSPEKAPLVLWLTGGPGCSSELAIFYENGPFKLDGTKVISNPHSWNTNANLLYIDQPVGTGFSKAKAIWDLKTNETAIAKDMNETITKFVAKHPELAARPFYITGESYAGHYIPALGKYLDDHKTDAANKDLNFKGVAIGNGLVDPINQYDAYATFAYHNKLIGKAFETVLLGYMQICKGITKLHIPFLDIEACNLGITSVLGLPVAPRFNTYDIRRKCDVPPLCYDFSDLDKLLKREDVITELGVAGRKWSQCNMEVHFGLLLDWSTNGSPAVAQMVNNGYKVYIYSGDKDYICNWEGGKNWTSKMVWKHTAEFNAAKFEDCAYGSCQEFENFKFIKVADAGHMVPMDQPEKALQMLNEFIGVV